MGVHKKYDDTRHKLQVVETEIFEAERARDEAKLAQTEAEEVAATYAATVDNLRRQMRDEKAKHDLRNWHMYLEAAQNNERDMMHAEETVSRYAGMKHALEEALKEREDNRQMIADYRHMQTVLRTVESERDQTLKEINARRSQIEKLEAQVTDKSAELDGVKDSHVVEIKDLKTEHNIEINELEQKVAQARLDLT